MDGTQVWGMRHTRVQTSILQQTSSVALKNRLCILSLHLLYCEMGKAIATSLAD